MNQGGQGGLADSRPRIVILANNVDEIGGVQRVVHALAKGLAGRGYPVSVVGLVPHEDRHPYAVDGAYEVHRLLQARMPPVIEASPLRLRADLKVRSQVRAWQAAREQSARALQDLLDSGRPGIVIATQLGTMELLGMCDLGDPASDTRWRVIAQYHSSLEAAVRSGDLTRAQVACRDADLFALLTAEDAQAFTAYGLDNTTWMENPLQAWPQVLADPHSRVVTFLGRYTALKAPEVLLDAWRILSEGAAEVIQGWSLRVYGSGPDEGRVREVAERMNGVQVFGATSDPLGVLAAGSILAMPSLEEGMPLVLAEAMSLGLACVATNCSSGVRALVQDGVTGLLVERGDAASLAAGLARVMAAPELRESLGAAARLRVERMREDRILDRWEHVIRDVLR